MPFWCEEKCHKHATRGGQLSVREAKCPEIVGMPDFSEMIRFSGQLGLLIHEADRFVVPAGNSIVNVVPSAIVPPGREFSL